MKKVYRLVLGFAITAQLLAFQNCSKLEISDIPLDSANNVLQATPLNPDPEPTPTPTVKCTDGKDITKPTKILLMVDASASNISDPADNNRIGTDDNKVWRSKVLRSVIAKYGNNRHISFGLLSFQGKTEGNEITAHIRASGSNQPVFSNDISVVQAAYDDFMTVVEGPGTPYPAAVFSARDIIKADLESNPGENATYAIIMLTDGQPSARRYDVDRGEAAAVAYATQDTQEIMALSPNIRFHGVYYHNDLVPPTDRTTKILKTITETGKGVFLTANSQPEYDFNIDTVLKFEPSQCE